MPPQEQMSIKQLLTADSARIRELAKWLIDCDQYLLLFADNNLVILTKNDIDYFIAFWNRQFIKLFWDTDQKPKQFKTISELFDYLKAN